MLKERADSGQAEISRADAVVALLLEMIEEGKHDVTVELLK